DYNNSYFIDGTLAYDLVVKLESIGITNDLTDTLLNQIKNFTPTPHLRFSLDSTSKIIKIDKTFNTDHQLFYHLRNVVYNNTFHCDTIPISSAVTIPEFLSTYYAKHPNATIVVES